MKFMVFTRKKPGKFMKFMGKKHEIHGFHPEKAREIHEIHGFRPEKHEIHGFHSDKTRGIHEIHGFHPEKRGKIHEIHSFTVEKSRNSLFPTGGLMKFTFFPVQILNYKK